MWAMVHLLLFGGAGILYAAAKLFKFGAFRLARIASFMDPWADPTGDGYQVIQGLYAIGSRPDYLE